MEQDDYSCCKPGFDDDEKQKEKERKEDEVIKVGGGMGSRGMDTKNCQI